MNVFITGATGVLGRVVSRLLIDGGHHVRGLAQNAHSESRLRSTGVEIFRGTLFDQASLRDGIKNCDAILHLATRIPPLKLASSPSAWKENDRIRIEGTR